MAPKNTGSKENILGPINFGSEKMLGPKSWVWKIFGQKNFGLKKCWDNKNFQSTKFSCQQKFWMSKNFGSTKILGPKKNWVKKKL